MRARVARGFAIALVKEVVVQPLEFELFGIYMKVGVLDQFHHTFLRLLRQVVHAFNVTDERDARLFFSILSLAIVDARLSHELMAISSRISGSDEVEVEKGGRVPMASDVECLMVDV